MDCVRTSKPPEFRRGCAEKRMRGLRKTLAQTEAVRRTIPAWAITAVPRNEVSRYFLEGGKGEERECTDE